MKIEHRQAYTYVYHHIYVCIAKNPNSYKQWWCSCIVENHL